MSAPSWTTISMGKMTLEDGNALIIANMQRDFLSGDILDIPDGGTIIPVVNRYLAAWSTHALPIFLSRCWHPPDHCSFQAQGGPWPPHCVADTPGAEFAPELRVPASAIVVSKATTRDAASPSAFVGTDLDTQLRRHGTTQIFIGGLGTAHGVVDTVRDAIEHGYETLVLRDAIRVATGTSDDGADAEQTMRALGVQLISVEMLGI
jgi:nicotinamidase/pyrazinamidase